MIACKEGKIFAAKEDLSRRQWSEQEHEYRSCFQRDRDRILYSKSFRRLAGKTQIFASGFDDYMRNRLTHTLEVSQIARTISDALGLNSDLTEAIALGHDIGHTPFGHVGERTLDYIMNDCDNRYILDNSNAFKGQRGFKHNRQGVRVACCLETSASDTFPGLNLTQYTLWGIENHTGKIHKTNCDYLSKDKKMCNFFSRKRDGLPCVKPSYDFYDNRNSLNNTMELRDETDWTFEAIVVAHADEIAQRHHDIEDGVFAHLIDKELLIEHLLSYQLFNGYERRISELKSANSGIFLKAISRLLVDCYVSNDISCFEELFVRIKKEFDITSDSDFNSQKREIYNKYIKHGDKKFGFGKLFIGNLVFRKNDDDFSEYLYAKILFSELAQEMDGKAEYIIRKLAQAYWRNPQQLPDKTIVSIMHDWGNAYSPDIDVSTPDKARKVLKDEKKSGDTNFEVILLRRICDYIAGMTDHYAVMQFNKLYGEQEFKRTF